MAYDEIMQSKQATIPHPPRKVTNMKVSEILQVKGNILYTVTPDAPLKAGEYAVVTYNSQIPVAGWFAGGFDSYFDFGVD